MAENLKKSIDKSLKKVSNGTQRLDDDLIGPFQRGVAPIATKAEIKDAIGLLEGARRKLRKVLNKL